MSLVITLCFVTISQFLVFFAFSVISCLGSEESVILDMSLHPCRYFLSQKLEIVGPLCNFRDLPEQKHNCVCRMHLSQTCRI